MTAGEEIAQNNARIAQLKQRLAELENSTSGNALDMRLAANRARIGDFGNAQSHLGRIETRNQWEQTKALQQKLQAANRISDAEYQYVKLDNELRRAKLERAYADPKKTKVIKELDDNVAAAQANLNAWVKKNPFLSVKVGSGEQENKGQQAQASSEYTIEGEKDLYDRMTYPSKDGKLVFWKDDVDPEDYYKYRERVNAVENEEWREQGRKARATQKMKQNVTDNTADNLDKYLKSIDNIRNGKYTSDPGKEKAKEMWDALDDQQKNDHPELKKKIFDTPSPTEYRTWLSKAKASGKNIYDSLPGEERDLADTDGKFTKNGKTIERREKNGEQFWIETTHKRTW